MKVRIFTLMTLLLVLITALPAIAKSNPTSSSHTQDAVKTDPQTVPALLSKLPLYFEPNQGQTDKQVKFLYHGNGYHLYLMSTESAIVLVQRDKNKKPDIDTSEKSTRIDKAVVRIELIGANRTPQITGMGKMRSRSNYLIGRNQERWRKNIPHYAKVQYKNLYSGIDLVYYGNQQQLEFDFIVAPGSSHDAIAMKINGAKSVSINDSGDLVLVTDVGDLIMNAPLVFQKVEGNRKNITGRYVLKGKDLIGFKVAKYDKSKPLIIDPVIRFSTYLGGLGWDGASDIAVDSQGAVYVAGATESWDFPVTGDAFDTICGDDTYLDCYRFYPPSGYTFSYEDSLDAFVAKLNPLAPEIVYITYLGGWEGDRANGIGVDESGNTYVVGSTRSPDFPTLNPIGGFGFGDCGAGDWYTYCRDGFVTNLTADGSDIQYSTFVGGSTDEILSDIALDTNNYAYVTGTARLVLKIAPNGSYVYGLSNYSFYKPNAIAVDRDNYAYVAGQWGSGNSSYAFIKKFSIDGTSEVYSYNLNGNGFDTATGIAVNDLGQAFVAGRTNSTNFPTLHPAQPAIGGGYDAFVTHVNATGDGIIASTYLGGWTEDGADDIVYLGPEPPVCVPPICELPLGIFNKIYVIGYTRSSDFPTQNAIQASFSGSTDAFVTSYYDRGAWDINHTIFTYDHLLLGFSSYLGGAGVDKGYGIDADDAANVYLVGETNSADFPLQGPVQLHRNISYDAFITMLTENGGDPWTDDVFNFDDGTSQGWTLEGGYNENGEGLFYTNTLFEWTDDTNYPNAQGTDSIGDDQGSIRMYLHPIHQAFSTGTGFFWIMQFHSPDLSNSTGWQQADGYSVNIGEYMANNEPIYANLFVRVYDNDLAQDRYFFSGTAQALNHNQWNHISFNWGDEPNFPANYIVREVFVNIWGPASDDDYSAEGVHLDEVMPIMPGLCVCDFDDDGDVDGLDFTTFISGSTGVDLEIFATEFGRINCQ